MLRPAQHGDAPSRREGQVAIALLFGRSNAQAATDLQIGVRTVECYAERLIIKFGARNRVDLVRILLAGKVLTSL